MNNAIKGKKNRAAGELFEKMISASCDWYLSEKVAKIEKQSEPMKVIKPLSLGRFVACFAKKSGVDYKARWLVVRLYVLKQSILIQRLCRAAD